MIIETVLEWLLNEWFILGAILLWISFQITKKFNLKYSLFVFTFFILLGVFSGDLPAMLGTVLILGSVIGGIWLIAKIFWGG